MSRKSKTEEVRVPNAHAVKLLKGQRRRAYGRSGRRKDWTGDARPQRVRVKERADHKLAEAERRRKIREREVAREVAKISAMVEKAQANKATDAPEA